MFDLDYVVSVGRPISEDDMYTSPYTFLGYKFNLPNYLMFDKSLLSVRDLPVELLRFLAKYDKVVGIYQKTDVVDYIVFRSLVDKEFLTLSNNRFVLYGLPMFKDFEYGKPIAVVEGLKDRDCFAQIYPYVVAMQSSALTSSGMQSLETLTDKVILLYDNDDRGHEMLWRDVPLLVKLGFLVYVIKHPTGVKDSGALIDSLYLCDSFQSDYLVDYYHQAFYCADFSSDVKQILQGIKKRVKHV